MRDEGEEMEETTRQMELEVGSEATRRRELSDNIAIIDKTLELEKIKKLVNKHKHALDEYESGYARFDLISHDIL